MFVKNFSWPSLNFNPLLFNQLTKQQKINVVIASIACGILLAGSAYWICSNFWCSRRIKPEEIDDFSPMPYKFPKDSSLDLNTGKKFQQKKSTSLDSTSPLRSPQLPPKNDKALNNEAKPEKLGASLKKKDEQAIEDEFEEVDLSSGSIHSAHSLSPPTIKVSICISSPQEAGFVGDEPELIPHLNKFKFANQTPLVLESTDIIISLNCFDFPPGLSLPSPMYLPASLFEDLAEGNSVQIYYEDQLLDLHLHQAQEESTFEEDNFDDVLELAKQVALEKNHPLFGRFIPYSWYKLDGGTVYRVVLHDHGRLGIKAVSSSEFRPLLKTGQIREFDEFGNEKLNEGNILKDFPMDITEKENGIYFTGDLPGFSNDDVDCIELILNDNLLATHILPLPRSTDITINMGEKENLAHLNPQEFVIGFKWRKIFPDFTLSEMQKLMEQAYLMLKNGTIQIVIPTNSLS